MVDDIGTTVDFIVDAFGIYENGEWIVTLEVEYDGSKELNAYARGPDLANLTDQGRMDQGSSHPRSSYPKLFKTNGNHYMTPSSISGVSFRILKSDNGLSDLSSWMIVEQHDKSDTGWVNFDPAPIYWKDRWYVFGGYNPSNEQYISLIYADETGRDFENKTWEVHPDSPIDTSGTLKPAGNVFSYEGNLILPLHDTSQGTSRGIFVRG